LIFNILNKNIMSSNVFKFILNVFI
jgi:hypothetical protein